MEYGKTGGRAQASTKNFGSADAALRYARKKATAKMKGKKKGGKVHSQYTEVKLASNIVSSGGSNAKGGKASNTDLKLIAESQIQFKDPQVRKLVGELAAANRHDIVTHTKGVTYDDKTGLFSTPLGVVTRDVVDDARKVLNDLGRMISRGEQHTEKFRKTLERYMTLIPMSIGHRRVDPTRILPDNNAVLAQNSTLDALGASLDMLDARKTQAVTDATKDAPQVASVFDVTLEVVDRNDPVWALIDKRYRESMNRSHQSANLKVARVLKIRIGAMNRGFEAYGASLDNIWELWHGTQKANLLSIIAKGFYIPPSNSAHCTGRMFGNGVYFSDQSTKALNYAHGYWGGNRDNYCFMFLCDVAMGNYYRPTGSSGTLHEYCRRNGFDSAFAEARKSGVMNNEMIAFTLGQINPRFLVQFSPTGRI